MRSAKSQIDHQIAGAWSRTGYSTWESSGPCKDNPYWTDLEVNKKHCVDLEADGNGPLCSDLEVNKKQCVDLEPNDCMEDGTPYGNDYANEASRACPVACRICQTSPEDMPDLVKDVTGLGASRDVRPKAQDELKQKWPKLEKLFNQVSKLVYDKAWDVACPSSGDAARACQEVKAVANMDKKCFADL